MTLQEMLDAGMITQDAFEMLASHQTPPPELTPDTPHPEPPPPQPKTRDWFNDFVLELNGDDIN